MFLAAKMTFVVAVILTNQPTSRSIGRCSDARCSARQNWVVICRTCSLPVRYGDPSSTFHSHDYHLRVFPFLDLPVKAVSIE